MSEKEATVYIVDVCRSMRKPRGGREQSDLDWALQYVWDKIATTVNTGRKTANLGVIGLGTDGTNNSLSSEPEYYNISVLQPITQILMPDVRKLQEQLKPSNTESADAISAIVLAIEMIEKHCKRNQWIRKIILVTGGRGATDPDLLDNIAGKIKDEGIQLVILGVDFDDAEYGFKEEQKPAHKKNNESLFRQLTETCDGVLGTMEEAINELSIPRVKSVRPVATYKGRLVLGDPKSDDTLLDIDIERYPKTMIAKPPTASSFALKQDASQHSKGMDNVDTQYLYQVDVPDDKSPLELKREDLAKGYAYGRTVVHISEADENVTKLETAMGYEILGFVPLENIERYMIIETSNMIIAQRTNNKAILALSSFIQALFINDSCAVARVVKKDMQNPLLTILSPSIDDNNFECLIENFLPFAEDLRSYRFPPLDKILTVSGKSLPAHRNLPTDELQSAMDNFVDSIDLTDYNGEEYMTADTSFSPVLHRIISAIKNRAVHSSAPVPPIAENLVKFSKPPSELLNKTLLNNLVRAANVKKVPLKVKGRKRFREAEKPLSGLNIEELFRNEKRTTKISPDNAIPEFKQLLAATENLAAVKDAVAQMAAIVENQIRSSFGDSKYNMALEGIGVMRQELVELEEPGLYNDLLRALKKKILAEELGGNRKEMWYLIRRARTGLIDKRISHVSEVTEVEAEAFMRI